MDKLNNQANTLNESVKFLGNNNQDVAKPTTKFKIVLYLISKPNEPGQRHFVL